MAAHSPAASPRLPSPPPIAEDQLGPASPGIALFEEHGKVPGNTVDTGAGRRIRPGTKAEDMAEGPPLVDLQDIDSAFPLTEHLKALHHTYTHPSSHPNETTPLTPSLAAHLALPPPNTSRDIWLYELARFLIQKTNSIIIALFADSPPCSPQTCSEMRASEWQYLCAVHDPPKSCAAIDYCCHTLDWAATTLTSSKMFPSRLGLGSQQSSGTSSSSATGGGGAHTDKVLQHQLREITNIFRRVYRIYAHAWFQHREMFWRVEGKTGLYGLFKRVCDEYGLIQAENYTIPREAEGLEPEKMEEREEEGREDGREDGQQQRMQMPFPQILARPHGATGGGEEGAAQQRPAGNEVLAAGDTTKRHRHTKSDLGNSVTPIIQEEAEEEEEEAAEEPVRQPEEVEAEVKPLQRQASELRSFAESLPQPGQQQHRQDEDRDEDLGEVPTESVGATEEAEGGELVEKAGDGAGEETAADDELELNDLPGVRRSDTVKPPPPSAAPETEGHASEGENSEGEGEQTALESGEAGVPEVEAQKENEAVDILEPTQASAAEAEEAGKSVGD
ncbi:hypothetical protein B0A55_06038 [Friedmanniomyces simplex]|uniref:Mob1/phocein n=1 Tax=Friedmanniomyces simplex TaxID=329884 RepID=A0A4U0X8D7_9PEZI|nr:hypothetical protein B0A55_06038 [Friedmanniomyces simplex]